MAGPASTTGVSKAGRLEFVDFLRGVAVLEMLAAHYSGYFPALFGKLVDYTETAMPLFLVLAGFIVGWGWRKFNANPMTESRVLLQRAARIIAVQYVIIATVGVPLYYLGLAGIAPDQQSLGRFLLESATFINQIGVIHILPTFVPLFLISPIILLALSRNLDAGVLVCSGVLLLIGSRNPYILSMGRPTVFPFILMQSYFVVGCLIGKRVNLKGVIDARSLRRLALFSLALLIAALLCVHGKILPTQLFSLHPLNAYGFIYQSAIMLALASFSFLGHPFLMRTWVYPYVTLFGRHALLAFTIHLYLAKMLDVINAAFNVAYWLNWSLVLLSVLLMKVLLEGYETNLGSAHQPPWTRAVHALFR